MSCHWPGGTSQVSVPSRIGPERSTRLLPSIPPSLSLPATAATKSSPPYPSSVSRLGPATVVAVASKCLLPYSAGTLPPTIWLGHHFSSKIHMVRLCRLAAWRQTSRSRYQPSPSQSTCGRDSAVKVPLPPSTVFSRYISSRSGLSSPCSQNKGPVSLLASMGSSANCRSRSVQSGSDAVLRLPETSTPSNRPANSIARFIRLLMGCVPSDCPAGTITVASRPRRSRKRRWDLLAGRMPRKAPRSASSRGRSARWAGSPACRIA